MYLCPFYGMLVVILTLIEVVFCQSPSPAPPIPASLLFNKYQVTNSSIVCNDGSPFSFYYRNCTANHDRHAGDPTDYCNISRTDWIIVFLSDAAAVNPSGGDANATIDGGYCYDAASCSARSSRLKSSNWLPETIFVDGLLSPFPELNPNEYKAHNVIVPYCTSDLWLGDGMGAGLLFDGWLAAEAVLRDLFSADLLPSPRLDQADRVVLIGGAGIMARIDDFSTLLLNLKRDTTGNASAALETFALCDGCLLQNVSTFDFTPMGVDAAATAPEVCTSDSNCPPSLGIPALETFVQIPRLPAWCTEPTAAACILGRSFSEFLAGDAQTPVLLQLAQYDQRQLQSYGAWPLTAGGSALAWAEAVFMPAVVTDVGAFTWVFSSACSAPLALATTSAWFHTLVRHVDSYNHTRNESLAVAAGSFFEDAGSGGFGPQAFGSYYDNCPFFVGCNPSQCAL